MRKIVLDTETTGLDPKLGHRIIEIAAIELDGRKISSRIFHRYVNPEREIDEGAIAIHGLTLDSLQNAPRFAEIIPALLAFIEGAELIIHNAPFDMDFLNAELARAGMPPLTNPVIDTMQMARELHPGKKRSLDALCERYQIDHSHRTLHGALLDAGLLAEVYLAMTRGQDSLLNDEDRDELTSGTACETGTGQFNVRVLAATDEELAQHHAQLEDIHKASKGACIWKKLQEQQPS